MHSACPTTCSSLPGRMAASREPGREPASRRRRLLLVVPVGALIGILVHSGGHDEDAASYRAGCGPSIGAAQVGSADRVEIAVVVSPGDGDASLSDVVNL